MQDIPLSINYKGKLLTGFAVPLGKLTFDESTAFDIIINKAFLGTLRWNENGWKMDSFQEAGLIEKIGTFIWAWYTRPIDSVAS